MSALVNAGAALLSLDPQPHLRRPAAESIARYRRALELLADAQHDAQAKATLGAKATQGLRAAMELYQRKERSGSDSNV